MAETYHTPVLLNEVIGFLQPAPGKRFIDSTFGFGGHSLALADKGGEALGIEADAIELGEVRKSLSGNRSIKLVEGNFREIGKIAHANGFSKVDGVLFDLGLSSWQLDHSGRGFSFKKDEPLDMRFDKTVGVTAADLVNGLYENELAELFYKFGQHPRARRFARVIAQRRQVKPFSRSFDLAKIIEESSGFRYFKHHPATRIFQALRIAVNQELENIATALPQALEILGPGGRLAVISFHSLEDRIVKRYFNECLSRDKERVLILTPRPVVPGQDEINHNPRSRSAKLRVLEKI